MKLPSLCDGLLVGPRVEDLDHPTHADCVDEVYDVDVDLLANGERAIHLGGVARPADGEKHYHHEDHETGDFFFFVHIGLGLKVELRKHNFCVPEAQFPTYLNMMLIWCQL